MLGRMVLVLKKVKRTVRFQGGAERGSEWTSASRWPQLKRCRYVHVQRASLYESGDVCSWWERTKEVGLHRGSALSPFSFTKVMDRLTDEVRQDSPRLQLTL